MLGSNRILVEKNDQEQMKHMCKSCNKSFPCGRSLGGHMRSHVINSSDHRHQKMKHSYQNNNGGNLMNNSKNNNTEAINGSSNSSDLGYELRKDPKKTLKAVINGSFDSNDYVVFDKICKECGKGFQSWKALFGHMKCHSDKVLNAKTMVFNQDSWINQQETDDSGAKFDGMKKSRSRNGVTKRSKGTNPTTATTVTTTATTITANTASSSVSMNPNHATTSVVSDVYDDEDEEVAMCLIMLSRDSGNWDKKMTRNGCKTKQLEKTKGNQEEFDHKSKRKFECTTCNKSFHSYQALGGHKASHKKLKGYFDYESINKDAIKSEPALDHHHMIDGCCAKTYENHQPSSSFNLGGSLKNKAIVGAYECSICLEVFSSGQALGGHKRSHLIAEAKLNRQNLNLIEKVDKPIHEVRGFLDLNLPPDDHVEEEEDQERMMMNASFTGAQDTPWRYNHESTLLGLLTTN